MRTWRVQAPLGMLFGALWLVTTSLLLVRMSRPVWPFSTAAYVVVTIPMTAPVIVALWGRWMFACLSAGLLMAVAVPWWMAWRDPDARTWRHAAAAATIAYWLVHGLWLAWTLDPHRPYGS